MRRAFSSLLVGGAAASGGGTIKLNWSDCGDSSTHGHITSLSPTSVVLGTKTSLAGKGTIDEAIPAATYKVVAKEGFIPIFSHTGDACKPGTIKLPAGAGEINMKGFKCPLSPGNAELDLDLTLSASIPAKLARITIVLTAESSGGDKALCVQIKTAPENLIADQDHPENLIPALGDSEQCQPTGRDCGLHGTKYMGECCPGLQCQRPTPLHVLECWPPRNDEAVSEDFVEGGKLQLGWKDCGDSSYHAKVTSLTPSTLTIGANTHVVGQGNVDEEVTAGSFTISSKAIIGPAEHFSGNVCQPKTFNLPMGLATITWDGLKCPVAKGQADVGVNVKLAASIPAKLARTTIDLKATSSSGHNLICMQMTTAPQQGETVAAIASSPGMTGDAMVSGNLAQELPPMVGKLVCKLATMGEQKAIDAICEKVPIQGCQDVLQNVFDKLLAKCQPGDEDFVEGGELKLGWKDCGDSSYHAKVTSLTPSTLTIGANTHVVGQGNVDEEVTAGSFTISSKAIIGPAEHFSGNVCQPKTFNLPMGLATITWDGLKCPVAKGQADVGVNVKLAASIPAKLARTTIDLKATSSSGHNLICMQMTTAPQQGETIVV